MAGRIKKAARRSDGLEEDVLTEDEDDFFVPVNTDCDGKSVASAESSQHRIQRHSFNDYGILLVRRPLCFIYIYILYNQFFLYIIPPFFIITYINFLVFI